MRRSALILAAWLSSAGMAHAGLFTDDEAQRKIGELQQQARATDTRVSAVEASVKNLGLVELLAQVEALKADIAKLHGQLEIATHDIETAQKRQKDFYVDLDTRLRRLENMGATPAVAGGAAAAAPSDSVGAAKPAAVDGAGETRAYEGALSLFKVGNYRGAIAGFESFLKAYPGSNLASSAQYWIGNSHFALHDFKSAIASQKKVVSLYPNSPKVPDALLNIASSQQELNDPAAARKTLEEVVAKYPLSNAAELAQKRLNSLR